MRTRKTVMSGLLVLGVLAVGPVQAKDPRVDAVEKLLMARWNTIPDDMVVEIVLDPVIDKAERYQVLQFFLDKQKTVARHREHVQVNYLPRLEKMFREMPAEDARSCQLILKGMANLQRERDQSDVRMLDFLQQQVAQAALPESKRAACQGMLAELQGKGSSPGSETWRVEEQKISEMAAKGKAGAAYKMALAALSDEGRATADRIGALECLEQMLARPTGVSFAQTRKDLTGVCTGQKEAALVESLVHSIMRAAFLEDLDNQHVVAVLEGLAKDRNSAVRSAAAGELAKIEAERQVWGFDLKAHLEEAERIVQRANLDAKARQEYRQLIDSSDYYAYPVGEASRWLVLGKFLQNRKAEKASIEALCRYLQTRQPSARLDEPLQQAVKMLAAERAAVGQEPVEYWAGLAKLPRGRSAQAFVKAVAETLSGPEGSRVLAAFGIAVLRQGGDPELAEAVLQNIQFSTQDVAALESAGKTGEAGRYCRTAVGAALAREGKSAEAAGYVDLKMADPLPGVPLFRAVGVADALSAAGNGEAAETLVRSLLARQGAAGQRINLLVYLMNLHLKAGKTAQAMQVQDELSQRYAAESPETVLDGLTKCITAVRDKNPEAELVTTRLLCEIMNGDTYRDLAQQEKVSPEMVEFWRGVREWTQDNGKTQGLEESVRQSPGSKEADLARVLLARSALNQGETERAGEWLAGVGEGSPVKGLAGEERRRRKAIADRERTLREQVKEIQKQSQDATVQAQCRTLLGQAAAAPGQEDSPHREGLEGEAYIRAMGQIGTALRAAGRYREAVECFHKGFTGAPYLRPAAESLRQEAWTLRFYMGAMEDSEARIKQIVAIYPQYPPGQWARWYLSTMANALHPE